MCTNTPYKCECGREFNSQASLNSHARFCSLYIKKTHLQSIYKISNNLYRCECGKEFNNYQSLNGHFGHCDIHCKSLNKKRNDGHKGTMNWGNKTPEEIKNIYLKRQQTIKLKQTLGIYDNGLKGTHRSEETKEKLRNIMNQKIINHKWIANYSKKACDYFDKLNKENNWNLQHALNGGEIIICGYWVDAYDKENNIIVEYDEPGHYKNIENNILNEKDLYRQLTLITKLNCSFYRYNEKLNQLYKINNEELLLSIYKEYNKLINDNLIDFTNSHTIKLSLNKYAKYPSYKLFKEYLNKYPK